MRLILDEDQQLLAKTAAQFAAEHSPVSRFRAQRASDAPLDLSTYREMAALGWTGLHLPEEYDGLDLGFTELSLVLQALGAQLAPDPFWSTVAAGQALALSDHAALKAHWLPQIASGEATLSLALSEPTSRYNLHHVAARATEHQDGGYVLKGRKVQVIGAREADAWIISARLSGARSDRDGIGLFFVTPDADGVSLTPQNRIDHRSAAILDLDGVVVNATQVLSTQAGPLLERVGDRATIALCSEMLGGMSRALDLTLEYLKERKQFGVPIGSFQALKHRAATLFTELTMARTAVMAACQAVDIESMEARVPAMASLAKARCSDAYVHIAHEGVQMFGGVGMTDEYDIGLYLKHARACELTLGDAAFHRDRWATLHGY